MATITTFDRKTARDLSDEVVAALQAVAVRNGLTVEAAGGTLGVEFTMKLKWGIVGVDKGKADFEQYAAAFGLEPSDHGKTFAAQGRTFEITGLKLGASKRPVLVREVGPSGRPFVFPIDAVKRALGRKVESFEETLARAPRL
jgi:hypothetical protein